jgi:hypothetical protein
LSVLVKTGGDRLGACRSVKQLRANVAKTSQDQYVGGDPHWGLHQCNCRDGNRSLDEHPSLFHQSMWRRVSGWNQSPERRELDVQFG